MIIALKTIIIRSIVILVEVLAIVPLTRIEVYTTSVQMAQCRPFGARPGLQRARVGLERPVRGSWGPRWGPQRSQSANRFGDNDDVGGWSGRLGAYGATVLNLLFYNKILKLHFFLKLFCYLWYLCCLAMNWKLAQMWQYLSQFVRVNFWEPNEDT